MGLAMPPTYAGYPTSRSSVVPVGSVAAPVMMVPTYGLPAYSHMPAYGTPVQVTTAQPAGSTLPPAAARPKPLSEEVSIFSYKKPISQKKIEKNLH